MSSPASAYCNVTKALRLVSVRLCACMSFPASAYCTVMKALVVALVEQPSLASWSRPNCLCAFESERGARERESAPAYVMFGLCHNVVSIRRGWTNVLCVCVQ